MNPLDFTNHHRLTPGKNTLFDMSVSVVSAAASHPFGVIKSLQQSQGAVRRELSFRHLGSGLPLRLVSTPIFLGLGGCNYFFKERFSEGGTRPLNVKELIMSALFSATLSAPFYQLTDVAIYHQNLARVRGEQCSLFFTAKRVWKIGGVYNTFPITAFLCAAGSINTLALGPLLFYHVSTREKSQAAGFAALSGYAMAYALLTQPLDTVRTRMQQNLTSKFSHVVPGIVRHEGIKVFWRGGLIRGLNHTASALSYVFFQYVVAKEFIS